MKLISANKPIAQETYKTLTMKHYIIQVIIIIALFGHFSNNLFAQDQVTNNNGKPIEYNFGHQYQIQSKILGEERQLLIYVPEEYQNQPTNSQLSTYWREIYTINMP